MCVLCITKKVISLLNCINWLFTFFACFLAIPIYRMESRAWVAKFQVILLRKYSQQVVLSLTNSFPPLDLCFYFFFFFSCESYHHILFKKKAKQKKNTLTPVLKSIFELSKGRNIMCILCFHILLCFSITIQLK